MNQELYEKRMRRMRLPKKYMDLNVSMDGIPDKCPHKDYILEYGRNMHTNLKEGRGLLLWGHSSTGKSAIAGMCLRSLFDFKEIFTGLWVTARRLPEYVIENTKFDDDETFAERMLSVDLLVIDEYIIFKGSQNTFRQDIVEHIFRDRADLGKATIITTNMNKKHMNEEAYTFFQVAIEHCEIIKVLGHNFREEMQDV